MDLQELLEQSLTRNFGSDWTKSYVPDIETRSMQDADGFEWEEEYENTFWSETVYHTPLGDIKVWGKDLKNLNKYAEDNLWNEVTSCLLSGRHLYASA